MMKGLFYRGRHRAPTHNVRNAAAVVAATALSLGIGQSRAFAHEGPANWGPIVRCESSGNPTVENPQPNSSASGLWQFVDGTWELYGGTEFGERAKDATPEEQFIVANRAYKAEGYKPWKASEHCWGDDIDTFEPIVVLGEEWQPPAEPEAPRPAAFYQVKEGDTLSGIAEAHGIDWQTLFDLNRDATDNPDVIFTGDELTLPDGATEPTAEPTADDNDPAALDKLDEFTTIQQDGYNSGPEGYTPSYKAEERDGALRFEVRPGDVPEFGGGERSEVRLPDSAIVKPGDEVTYTFSLKFDKVPADSGWFIVTQWHAGEGSPPLALQVTDGVLELSNNRDGTSTPIGPVRPGEWVDYRLDAVFGTGENAVVQVFESGQPVAEHRHPNMASDESYMKLGIYRDRGPDAASVWFDNFTVQEKT